MEDPPPQSPGDPPGPPESPGGSRTAPDRPQQRPRGRPPARTQLRNRRFAALRELIRGGEYFSEQQMRRRSPRLFHHYIGRFQGPQNPQNHPKIPQNHPEIPQNHPKNPQNHPKNPQNCPNPPQNRPNPPQNLRELLLNVLEESEAQDDEEEDEEEDEDEEDEAAEAEGRLLEPRERELLRLEFTSQMYLSFLEGQDGDFDYSQVDENPELDDLELLGQDLQDRYFDEEEPSQAPLLD